MRHLKLILCAVLCFILIGCEQSAEVYKPSAYDNAILDGEIIIVVDAGHGLSDVGALNEENLGNISEADINFAIASMLSEKLSEKYTVIMSHNGETRPESSVDDGDGKYNPTERAEFSNSTSADLFISIHCDSFPSNADVYGTRVYYADGTPNSTEFDYKISKAIGDAVNAQFAGGKEVILKPMDSNSAYTVLYKTTAPSVLVECGFITNKGDAEKLIDSEWQNEFASAIANGVDTYFAH